MKVVFTIVVVAVMFTVGEALKCYKQDPTYDSFDLNKATIVDCPSVCTKNVADLDSGSVIYARGCGANKAMIQRNRRSEEIVTIKTAHQHLCDKDLCNGAAISVPVIFALMTTVTAVLLNQY